MEAHLNRESFTTPEEVSHLLSWISDDSDMLESRPPDRVSLDLKSIVKIHHDLLALRYAGYLTRSHAQPQAILLALAEIQKTVQLFQNKIRKELR